MRASTSPATTNAAPPPKSANARCEDTTSRPQPHTHLMRATQSVPPRPLPGRPTPPPGLDDANLVGNIERVVVGCQADVSLLETVGPDERVDLGGLDLVHA